MIVSLTELKAVLQRSPIRFCGNRGELPTCTEDNMTGEEAQSLQEGNRILLFICPITPIPTQSPQIQFVQKCVRQWKVI